MSAQHHCTIHHHKARHFWLRQETMLGTLAAFLAFALVYAYTADTDLYYPFVGALSMVAVTYTVVWLAVNCRL